MSLNLDPALGLPVVYLVDDEDVVRDALAWLLRSRRLPSQGFDSARAFEQALDAAPPESPACILLDVRMPGTSGLALFDRLLERGIASAWPVIFLTGHASVATAVEAIKLGAHHYLAKPSNTDDIEAAFARTEGDADVRLTPRQTSIKTLEWEHIHEALAAADFNISEAARQLGMHRRTLARKLEKQRVK